MASSVDICNDAIGRVGGVAITSLEDASVEAKQCKAKYAQNRDALLEEFDWRFATRRIVLPPDVAEPTFGYAYAFTLPSTVARVLSVEDGSGDDTVDWQLEDRKVLCDVDVVYLKVNLHIDDPTAWPAMFREALSYRIAAEICVPVCGDKALYQFLLAVADRKVKAAQQRDGGQGRSRVLTTNEISSSRY